MTDEERIQEGIKQMYEKVRSGGIVMSEEELSEEEFMYLYDGNSLLGNYGYYSKDNIWSNIDHIREAAAYVKENCFWDARLHFIGIYSDTIFVECLLVAAWWYLSRGGQDNYEELQRQLPEPLVLCLIDHHRETSVATNAKNILSAIITKDPLEGRERDLENIEKGLSVEKMVRDLTKEQIWCSDKDRSYIWRESDEEWDGIYLPYFIDGCALISHYGDPYNGSFIRNAVNIYVYLVYLSEKMQFDERVDYVHFCDKYGIEINEESLPLSARCGMIDEITLGFLNSYFIEIKRLSSEYRDCLHVAAWWILTQGGKKPGYACCDPKIYQEDVRNLPKEKVLYLLTHNIDRKKGEKEALAKKYFWAVPDQELCPSEMREAFAEYPHYIAPCMGGCWRRLRDEKYLDDKFKPRRANKGGEWTWNVGKSIVDWFHTVENRRREEKNMEELENTEWAPFEKYWVVRNLRTKNAPLGDGEKGQKLGRIFEDSLKEILSEKKK